MARTSEARARGAARPFPLRAAFRAIAGIPDLLAPPACLHCGSRRWGKTPLCLACLRRLDFHRAAPCPRCGDPACRDGHGDWPRAFDSAQGLFRVTPELSTLVHGFKYRHQARNARFLAAWIRFRPDLLGLAAESDGLVPVPLHAARRRERGYNQAEIIARVFAATSGVRVIPGVLRRVRATGTQTRLGKAERVSNLDGAFLCPDPSAVVGKRLILVDDVLTTGATAEACALALRRAGCASVKVLALGRVSDDAALGGDDFVREIDAAAAYLA